MPWLKLNRGSKTGPRYTRNRCDALSKTLIKLIIFIQLTDIFLKSGKVLFLPFEIDEW